MMTLTVFIKTWRKVAKNRCFYCGIEMTRGLNSITSATVEHIYPRHAVPKGLHYNTATACIGCNGAKNGFPVEQFRQYRGGTLFCEKILGERIPALFVSTNSFGSDLNAVINKSMDRISIGLHTIFAGV